MNLKGIGSSLYNSNNNSVESALFDFPTIAGREIAWYCLLFTFTENLKAIRHSECIAGILRSLKLSLGK